MANAVIIKTDLHQATQINSVDYAIAKITDKNRLYNIFILFKSELSKGF